ncbi:GSK3-beta interaction protein-like [Tachypleus tridentatus]|uniref:GSK3-beta interaction protein-like n=1 Tax=Tachypleus tridentatus TaxID=6853 RepID=UPI003FD22FB0
MVDNSNTGKDMLDEPGWEAEGQAVVEDVSFAVKEIHISTALPITESAVYLNIETKEGQKLCVEMSSRGFCVVGNEFNSKAETDCSDDAIYFETPYALLDKYSPLYRDTFGNTLICKLNEIKEMEDKNNK